MSAERIHDWFLGGDARHTAAIIPRVIPIEPNGTLRLIRHKGRKGALGGHITLDEASRFGPETNLLDVGAMAPTLDRETFEEGGVALGSYLERSAILGIAEILMVRLDTKTSVDTITPMIICQIPGGLPFTDQVIRVPWGHIPPDTYPDATLAMIHLYTGKRTRRTGPIMPEFLNKWGKVVYELSPERKYLRGEPPLRQLGFTFDHPDIPKRYPTDIRMWLEDQYDRL